VQLQLMDAVRHPLLKVTAALAAAVVPVQKQERLLQRMHVANLQLYQGR